MVVPNVITYVVIGAGNRGQIYAKYALNNPTHCKVVAVAEPHEFRRNKIATEHCLDEDRTFSDWRSIHKLGFKIADAVVISVMDDLHAEIVHLLAPMGYDILCEKPIATSMQDCVNMLTDIKSAECIFGVGHVLRYSLYNKAVKTIIDSGVLGDIVNVQHLEPVGHEHFAHSFVRGNWRSERETTFSLMAKSCHDIDILAFYFGSLNKPKLISSFGSLHHFNSSQKPISAGAATRCTECAYETQCAYSAKKIYLEPVQKGLHKTNRLRTHQIVDVVDIENVASTLATSRWGECVYNGTNDVNDQQVVNIQMDGGQTASFTMVAFSEAECYRTTRIHGTRGELIGDMQTITVNDFVTKSSRTFSPGQEGIGHGGGDWGLMRSFLEAVASRDQSALGVSPDEILRSHLVVFAAEEARREGKVVRYGEWEEKVLAQFERGRVEEVGLA